MIRRSLSAAGSVEPSPGADQEVLPPEHARIAELPVAAGDTVRRGDLLVRFEVAAFEGDLAVRTGEVNRLEARVRTARSARDRAIELVERGIAPRRQVEDAERELADAEGAAAEAQAARTAAASLVERSVVRALFDGVVATLSGALGDFVAPSAPEPVVRVVDPRRLEVTAAIPTSELSRVAVGAAARVTGTPGGPAESARVISGPLTADPGSPSAPVRLQFVAPTVLPLGAQVQVEIEGEQRADAVLVPAAAVVREQGDTVVYVVRDSRAERVRVRVGLSDAGRVEIRAGLRPGDIVIIEGQAGLSDGDPVVVEPKDK